MKNYPKRYDEIVQLMKQLGEDIPATMQAFGDLHHASTADGALPKKVKELIALAIGISVRCDGCIAFHVHDALKAGATEKEIIETIGTAVLMGGGPSMVYGCDALAALKQFKAQPVEM